MHTQQAHSFGDLPLFQSVTANKPASRFNESDRHAPRFVQSVVEEAGLGRFVYLRGCSGRRYVFSVIKPEQIGLYEHAVFAFGGVDGSPVELTCNATHEGASFAHEGPIYVHLLSDDDGAGGDVIADLSSAMQ